MGCDGRGGGGYAFKITLGKQLARDHLKGRREVVITLRQISEKL
jgi:hypothetical protein